MASSATTVLLLLPPLTPPHQTPINLTLLLLLLRQQLTCEEADGPWLLKSSVEVEVRKAWVVVVEEEEGSPTVKLMLFNSETSSCSPSEKDTRFEEW